MLLLRGTHVLSGGMLMDACHVVGSGHSKSDLFLHGYLAPAYVYSLAVSGR